jgi:DNA polymerase-3 subunit delta'
MAAGDTTAPAIVAECLPWQKPVVSELLALKRQDRLPHGLLVEMQTAADSAAFGWYLSTTLLCDNPGDAGFCGHCHHCALMRANSHPDFTFTTRVEDAKSHKLNRDIRIDQVRRLIHQLNLTDSMRHGSCALIYPAERMNSNAANSLLKTLEEPSAGSTLLLLTHHASRLPITIRSRCQRWTVANPDRPEALRWLEEQSLSAGQAEASLDLANGDAQYALKLQREQYLDARAALEEKLQLFYQGKIDAVTAVGDLKSIEVDVLRHLVKAHYLAQLRQLAGQQPSSSVKSRMAGLLDLVALSERLIRGDEHNLNVLLQLEDVLISGKRILTRG